MGERLAAEYLIERGYKIIARNVKTSYKELDLIAQVDEVLVFVEVKTRTSFFLGGAQDMITKKKLQNLKRAAAIYLSRNKNNYKNLRFDFLAVDYDLNNKKANIKHYLDII